MVYRGKPSTGCGECRKRRSKCDQAIPSCRQCIRAKRVCPGYRDPIDLMFFDQSHDAIPKKSKSRSLKISNPATSNPLPAPSNITWAVQRTTPVHPAPIRLDHFVLRQHLDDLALNHFMRHEVKQSQFGFLPEFFSREGSACKELRQSLVAVGLASYAKMTQRFELLYPATKCYSIAVRDLNDVLSRSNLVGREATLISVVLLAMFEIMVLPRTLGLENLGKHLQGAMTIACLSMKQKNLTAIQREMLGIVVQTAIMHSWMQSTPLPAAFLICQRELGKQELVGSRTTPESLHARFLGVLLEFANFRTALDHSEFASPTSILNKALTIDANLKYFVNGIPKHCQFEKVLAPDDSKRMVYDGYYHVYPSICIVHLWNNVRLSQLHLQRIIIAQCTSLLHSTEFAGMTTTGNPESNAIHHTGHTVIQRQKAKSEATLKKLAMEICAALPQLAGYVDQLQSYKDWKRRAQTSDYMNAPSRIDSEEVPRCVMLLSSQKPVTLFMSFYQLFSLTSMPLLPVSMKPWISSRLRIIEENAPHDNTELLKALLDRLESGTEAADSPGTMFDHIVPTLEGSSRSVEAAYLTSQPIQAARATVQNSILLEAY